MPLEKRELEMQQAHATALARECQTAGFSSLEPFNWILNAPASIGELWRCNGAACPNRFPAILPAFSFQ